jgi:hypothetical protein
VDHVTLRAHVIHPLLRVLRAARIAPVAAMPASDLRSKAYGLSYAILASLWLRRKGELSWKDVYEAWDQHSLLADEPDPSLYGQFHPDDRFELLTNNRDAFVERGHLLKNARHSVDVAAYYIQADETGGKTAHQLAECVRRGVRVRIVSDHALHLRRFSEASESGVQLEWRREFRSKWGCDPHGRDHRAVDWHSGRSLGRASVLLPSIVRFAISFAAISLARHRCPCSSRFMPSSGVCCACRGLAAVRLGSRRRLTQ